MSRLKHLLYVLLFWLSLSLFSNSSLAFSCVSLKQMHKKLFESGYTWLFTAVTSNYAVIQLFVNQKAEYVIIGIDDDQNACELMHGSDFIFAFNGGA